MRIMCTNSMSKLATTLHASRDYLTTLMTSKLKQKFLPKAKLRGASDVAFGLNGSIF